MSKGEQIFQEVVKQPDHGKAVRALSPKRWLKLYGYVLRNYDENEPSGQILAIMLFDGARRYATDVRSKRGKVKQILG